MKKIKYLLGIIVFSFFVFSTHAAEASVKIGTVDLQKALLEVNKGKKAKSDLEKSMKTRESKFKKEQESLQKEQEEFQKKSMVLSEEARQKKGMELQKKFVELQQLGARYENEFQQEQLKATQPILKEMAEMLPTIGKDKKVDLVLEKNAGLLYAADSVDLTGDLIGAYNKKYK